MRAGIVAHAAHQRRVKFKTEFDVCNRFNCLHDRCQILCLCRIHHAGELLAQRADACRIVLNLCQKSGVFLNRLWRITFCKQLFADTVQTDLIHLIENDKYLIGLIFRESAVICHAL